MTSGKPGSQCEKLHSQITIKGSKDSHFGKSEETSELGLAHCTGGGQEGETREEHSGHGVCLGEEQSG